MATAKRLETRGNLDAAAEYRKSAARTYRFTGELKKSREQYSLAAGIHEKAAAINEKEGYIGLAALNMERAGALYNELSNRDKAKECYSKAIALNGQYLMRQERSDPHHDGVFERDSIARLMRMAKEADKL